MFVTRIRYLTGTKPDSKKIMAETKEKKKIKPHVVLSTDELASLEIDGFARVVADGGEDIVVRTEELSISIAELANPFGEEVAIGNGYTVSA